MDSRNIKTTFIIFFSLIFLGFTVFVVAQENSSSDINIFLDTDQDGLSDEEEKTYGTDPNKRDTDGDGYSDGSEIKSGYDPKVPAPGDKIVDENEAASSGFSTDGENLTEKLSVELANLLNDKASVEDGKIEMEDLDSLIEETTGEFLTFDDLPEVNKDEIKIKDQDYSDLSDKKREQKLKEDAVEYLTQASYIVISNSPQEISDDEDIENLTSSLIEAVSNFSPTSFDASLFDQIVDKEEMMLEQLKELEVPEEMIDLHIKGLKLVNFSSDLRENARPVADDPIKTIINLSKINSFLILGEEYSKEIITAFEKYDITEPAFDL